MNDTVRTGLARVATFVPELVLFLVVLVVGLLLARVLARLVGGVLERVGFDRAVERGGIKRALASTRYDASDVVGKLVQYALVLFVLQLAFGVFGTNPVSTLLARLIAYLPQVFFAIVLLVVAAAVARVVRDAVTGALVGLSYGRVLGTTAGVFVLGLGVIAALDQLGVASSVTSPVLVTVLATAGGILVVGVGGGLVRPMQSRWETWLDTAARESSVVSARVSTAVQARDQARREAEAAEAARTAEHARVEEERRVEAERVRAAAAAPVPEPVRVTEVVPPVTRRRPSTGDREPHGAERHGGGPLGGDGHPADWADDQGYGEQPGATYGGGYDTGWEPAYGGPEPDDGGPGRRGSRDDDFWGQPGPRASGSHPYGADEPTWVGERPPTDPPGATAAPEDPGGR